MNMPLAVKRLDLLTKACDLDEFWRLAAEYATESTWMLCESPAALTFARYAGRVGNDLECNEIVVFCANAEIRMQKEYLATNGICRLMRAAVTGREYFCQSQAYLLRPDTGGRLLYEACFAAADNGFLQFATGRLIGVEDAKLETVK